MDYKGAPKCPKCDKSMVYLYTDIKRWKSVWKCRECDTRDVTNGYPEEEDNPHKRRANRSFCVPVIFSQSISLCPKEDYENRRVRIGFVHV